MFVARTGPNGTEWEGKEMTVLDLHGCRSVLRESLLA